jgi:hypothetical protein
MVAAVTAPSPTELSSWTAAYLVLVAGVAQIGLGCGLAFVPGRLTSARMLGELLLMWNLGNSAVVAGTLANRVWVIDVGGVLLVATLVLSAWVTRNAGFRQWPWISFRFFQAALLVSVPIGLMLARRPSS